jgi:hypothetical protein
VAIESCFFYRLKKIKKDLDDKEKLQKQEKPTAEVKQARLSKHAYKPLPMAIQLSDELTDSLRTLKVRSYLCHLIYIAHVA